MKTFLIILLAGCASQDMVHQALNDHPEWVLETFEKNPEKFLTTMTQLSQKAQSVAQAKQVEADKLRRDEEFKNPKSPEIGSGRAIRGNTSAPVTLVEYSDFQCGFCQRGFNTVEELRKKYGDKLRFVFKHLPLDFHPLAMPTAKRFEAISLVSAEKAYAFHDAVFKEQNLLGTEKEAFLDKVTKKLGLNLAQVKKLESDERVTARISADMNEAKSFGFSGTPGFIVGGISLAGAYPTPAFEEIIERRLSESKPNS